MRGSICGVLVMVAALAVLAPAQTAQTPNTTAGKYKPSPHRSQVPYTATYQETIVDTLHEGATNTNVGIVFEARDSRERQIHSATEISSPGTMNTVTRVSVNDSASRTVTFWTVENPGERQIGQATEWHQAAPGAASAPCPTVQAPELSTNLETPPPDDRAENIHRSFEDIRAQVREKYPVTKTVQENLGVKTIKGIEVRGVRITSTFMPASARAEPSETIEETWRDTTPGLGSLQVLHTIDSPGRKYRKELMSLTLGEPDPALFNPPAGFDVRIVEEKPHGCANAGARAVWPAAVNRSP
jgi:hypothetical protein